MLVSEETSRAWNERRALLEDLQQQQLEMLDRLKDTEITSRINLASAVYTVEYLTGYVPDTVSD